MCEFFKRDYQVKRQLGRCKSTSLERGRDVRVFQERTGNIAGEREETLDGF
jgi:hypothetical protein